MVPLSLVMKPPQAAGEAINEHKVCLVLFRHRAGHTVSWEMSQTLTGGTFQIPVCRTGRKC